MTEAAAEEALSLLARAQELVQSVFQRHSNERFQAAEEHSAALARLTAKCDQQHQQLSEQAAAHTDELAWQAAAHDRLLARQAAAHSDELVRQAAAHARKLSQQAAEHADALACATVVGRSEATTDAADAAVMEQAISAACAALELQLATQAAAHAEELADLQRRCDQDLAAMSKYRTSALSLRSKLDKMTARYNALLTGQGRRVQDVLLSSPSGPAKHDEALAGISASGAASAVVAGSACAVAGDAAAAAAAPAANAVETRAAATASQDQRLVCPDGGGGGDAAAPCRSVAEIFAPLADPEIPFEPPAAECPPDGAVVALAAVTTSAARRSAGGGAADGSALLAPTDIVGVGVGGRGGREPAGSSRLGSGGALCPPPQGEVGRSGGGDSASKGSKRRADQGRDDRGTADCCGCCTRADGSSSLATAATDNNSIVATQNGTNASLRPAITTACRYRERYHSAKKDMRLWRNAYLALRDGTAGRLRSHCVKAAVAAVAPDAGHMSADKYGDNVPDSPQPSWAGHRKSRREVSHVPPPLESHHALAPHPHHSLADMPQHVAAPSHFERQYISSLNVPPPPRASQQDGSEKAVSRTQPVSQQGALLAPPPLPLQPEVAEASPVDSEELLRTHVVSEQPHAQQQQVTADLCNPAVAISRRAGGPEAAAFVQPLCMSSAPPAGVASDVMPIQASTHLAGQPPQPSTHLAGYPPHVAAASMRAAAAAASPGYAPAEQLLGGVDHKSLQGPETSSECVVGDRAGSAPQTGPATAQLAATRRPALASDHAYNRSRGHLASAAAGAPGLHVKGPAATAQAAARQADGHGTERGGGGHQRVGQAPSGDHQQGVRVKQERVYDAASLGVCGRSGGGASSTSLPHPNDGSGGRVTLSDTTGLAKVATQGEEGGASASLHEDEEKEGEEVDEEEDLTQRPSTPKRRRRQSAAAAAAAAAEAAEVEAAALMIHPQLDGLLGPELPDVDALLLDPVSCSLQPQEVRPHGDARRPSGDERVVSRHPHHAGAAPQLRERAGGPPGPSGDVPPAAPTAASQSGRPSDGGTDGCDVVERAAARVVARQAPAKRSGWRNSRVGGEQLPARGSQRDDGQDTGVDMHQQQQQHQQHRQPRGEAAGGPGRAGGMNTTAASSGHRAAGAGARDLLSVPPAAAAAASNKSRKRNGHGVVCSTMMPPPPAPQIRAWPTRQPKAPAGQQQQHGRQNTGKGGDTTTGNAGEVDDEFDLVPDVDQPRDNEQGRGGGGGALKRRAAVDDFDLCLDDCRPAAARIPRRAAAPSAAILRTSAPAQEAAEFLMPSSTTAAPPPKPPRQAFPRPGAGGTVLPGGTSSARPPPPPPLSPQLGPGPSHLNIVTADGGDDGGGNGGGGTAAIIPPHPLPHARQAHRPTYKYVEVVRKHSERAMLPAGECEQCRGFYAALDSWGPAGGAANISAATLSCGHVPRLSDAGAVLDAPAVPPSGQQARREVSRHRARWAPPSTPDGFWHLGFPDSEYSD